MRGRALGLSKQYASQHGEESKNGFIPTAQYSAEHSPSVGIQAQTFKGRFSIG